MHRSVIPAVIVSGLFSVAAFGAGCTIVTNPGPNNGASSAAPAQQPQGNRSGLPVLRPGQTATATPTTAPAATGTTAPTATTTATATAPAVAAGPPGPKVTVDGKEYTTVSAPIPFGAGENRPGMFKGFVFFLPSTTNQLPNFDGLTPAGVLFTPGFAVNSATYTEGFPGLDAGRVDFFGLRYEGDFAVTSPGDYVFKLESDDGAKLTIDSLPLITMDGIHTAQTKTGTVKLSAGPHRMRLEYFQAARGAATLRLLVASPGGAEKPFAALL